MVSNWHGPYKVDQVLPGNAYMLEELDGVKFPMIGQHVELASKKNDDDRPAR